MKTILTVLGLCLTLCLFGQAAAECSANAGPDQTICFNEQMTLSAPVSLDYNNPPNIEWTVADVDAVGVDPEDITFSNPDAFNTSVTIDGGVWVEGTYTFKFCVDCKDINNDGVKDKPCDEVTITVKPDVTQPVITELDGTQDGMVTVCSSADLQVNLPGAGEIYSVSVFPDDGLVTATLNGTILTVQRADPGNPFIKGNCTYEVTYYISNGGCVREEAVEVTFIKPYDPNGDGVIEGFINICPSCTDKLYLYGDNPGCGGNGAWSLVSAPPGATVYFDPQYFDVENGDAIAEVSHPGTYTFVYTVTNVAPCPNSTFEVTCTVIQAEEFSIGPDQTLTFCGNVAPAGNYTFTINQLPNTIYDWTLIGADPSEVIISQPAGSNTIEVVLLVDQDLSDGPVIIVVKGTRYFLDPDCEGPLPASLITLPFNDPEFNLIYISKLKNNLGQDSCIYECTSTAILRFIGAPVINVPAEDVYFLCSDGTEAVKLADYYSVSNFSQISTVVTVVEQPPGSNLTYVSPQALLQLQVDGCGKYKFKIEVTSINDASIPPVTCKTTAYLTIHIAEAQPVTAGTDQIKCCNEPIRLNGNNPYACEALGTWRLVSCSNGCTVTIVDPHDPNTQIFVNDDCSDLPVILELEWSFSSQDTSCDLSDITQVEIRDCTVPCNDLDISVQAECIEDKIILTVTDQNGFLINPYVYDITWWDGGTDNPHTVQYNGAPLNYSVEVSFMISETERCYDIFSGIADCDTTHDYECGIRIIESCDECGNVVLTAVDENNIPVPPTTYLHEFHWKVFGGGMDDNSGYNESGNPITINPTACYSLNYTRYYYPPGAPPIPGTWDSICTAEFPKTCVSISCPGPCRDFPQFFIAGCGDVLDQTLNLPFPGGCHDVCASVFGASVTLGVFYIDPVSGLPVAVNPLQYNILWKNGSTGAYVNGQLLNINSVTITQQETPCCFWKDVYRPICCDETPSSIQCQQPIVKHCYDDGTVTYTPGLPQIAWAGVAGAIGYELEVTQGGVEGCCEGEVSVQYYTVGSSPWVIPSNLNCFTIRIRAIFPENVCVESNWSEPYVFCETTSCSPVIIVCGCCDGLRSAENATLPVVVMPEAELVAYLETCPGPAYPSLQQALIAIGQDTPEQPVFSVYPNPANDAITIRPSAPINGVFTVQLTDLLQRQWQNKEFSGEGNGSLNISELPQGIYILSIRDFAGKLLLAQKVTVLR